MSARARWIAPATFTDETRRHLLLLLQGAPLSEEQKADLIEACETFGAMQTTPDKLGDQVDQLKKVASDARRLLASMNLLGGSASQALAGQVEYLTAGSSLDDALPARLQAGGRTTRADVPREWVRILQQAAEDLHARIQPSKQAKPEELAARGFVGMVAGHVRTLTGELPPPVRNGWFANFIEATGAAFDMAIGPGIVASGVSSQRAKHADD